MAKHKSGPRKPGGSGIDIGMGILGSLTDFVERLEEIPLTKEQKSRRQHVDPEGKDGKAATGSAAGNRFSQMLGGLADLAEKLKETSEHGESGSRTGEFTSKDGGIKGVYGFTFKTGLGGKDDQIRVEPFGNVRKDKKTGEAVVQEISEPLVDVFEDENATTLVAEMPGVGKDDIKIDVQDDILTIQAQKGEKKYRKEILLRHGTTKAKVKVTSNNGIVTIRCEKAK